jgi:hypothetical protein
MCADDALAIGKDNVDGLGGDALVDACCVEKDVMASCS